VTRRRRQGHCASDGSGLTATPSRSRKSPCGRRSVPYRPTPRAPPPLRSELVCSQRRARVLPEASRFNPTCGAPAQTARWRVLFGSTRSRYSIGSFPAACAISSIIVSITKAVWYCRPSATREPHVHLRCCASTRSSAGYKRVDDSSTESSSTAILDHHFLEQGPWRWTGRPPSDATRAASTAVQPDPQRRCTSADGNSRRHVVLGDQILYRARCRPAASPWRVDRFYHEIGGRVGAPPEAAPANM